MADPDAAGAVGEDAAPAPGAAVGADAHAAPPADGEGRAGAGGAAAKGAGAAVRRGLAAVRDVRAAARLHADARSQMRALKGELDEAAAQLERRERIEGDYERIVTSRTQQLEAAQLEQAAARRRSEALAGERQQLEARLEALKADNEERLRPYRDISDAAKGRADEAAVSLAEARRALKAADAQVSDAVAERDQRVSAASHALDGAQARLHQAQAAYDRLALDMTSSPEALGRLREELRSEAARLEAARGEVAQVSDEAQLAVDNAQTHLWTQRQSLEVAERRADEAKREAAGRREEYDTLYRQAKAAEGELAEAIKARGRAGEQAAAEGQAAAERAQEARDALAEANEVRATPEVTAALRRRLAAGQRELEQLGQQVSDLARQERGLRRRTRGQRLAFFAAVAALAVAVALVVWLLLPRG